MTIFGTRPEAIKMCPLILEFKNNPETFQPIVVVTGQHRQMLDQVLDMFHVTPDVDLNIMKSRQTLSEITSRVLNGLDQVIKEYAPHLILVHGDTTTTFAASLAAFYNQIPVGHVEAGLRTWNKQSPFPEEVNRQLTGVLSDLHFAPTEKAAVNLLNEGKESESIFITGNTVIDALKTTVCENYNHEVLQKISSSKMILVTVHRRENLGEPMKNMFRAFKRLVNNREDFQLVYPVHMNPLIKKLAAEELGNDPRIHLIEPLGVRDFHNFLGRATLVLTDSGGIQEEAPSLGVPVLVLRETTERPEGVEAGTVKLAGTEEENIYYLAKTLLTDENAYAAMAKATNPYGDGNASKRIIEAIKYYLGIQRERPNPFKG
ncbi:MAG: UDP-N-acetylglucosamine 2-epimerase (non-hydrolyzing) [Bacillus sp. (in: Bacteria)]|nr:UDP-N-acetylglucosamine 2-epimerase (non-hydrolyzing) [Bacillus sp. (in: firmicutes)]